MNSKRSSVFWAATLAELALAVYALTSFAWVQAPESGPDAALASAAHSPSVQR